VLGEDGMPIAVYMNYAMHPINFYLTGQISADFPGAASNYIESRYPGAVAVFSQGSSGDQNPLLVDPLHKLIAVRAGNYAADGDRLDIPGPWKPRSAAALAAQPPTGAATDKTDPAAYRAAVEHSTQIVNAMGALIGQTALGVVKYLTPQMATTGSIWAEQQTISCPGRDRADAANPVRQGSLPPYNDGAPANIRVGLLRIADINLVSINGEVYSEIGSRIKAESPASKTMVVTLANGRANSGYIYSNDAGHRLTFQVIGSRLKPGCAEDRIVGATNAMFRNAAP
jgi:neutral ceramidase